MKKVKIAGKLAPPVREISRIENIILFRRKDMPIHQIENQTRKADSSAFLRAFAASHETYSSGGDEESSREGAKNAKKKVARKWPPTYKGANTRAVPLVRKEDVHHGRVFMFQYIR